MEKTQYDKEINRLIDEAIQLEEKEQIGYDTAVFLDTEAKKLEEIIENPDTEEKEREIAITKLNILFGKIKNEMNHSNDNDCISLRIESELLALTTEGYDYE
jgi:hypothetical protein